MRREEERSLNNNITMHKLHHHMMHTTVLPKTTLDFLDR